jgi:hypothetical protein
MATRAPPYIITIRDNQETTLGGDWKIETLFAFIYIMLNSHSLSLWSHPSPVLISSPWADMRFSTLCALHWAQMNITSLFWCARINGVVFIFNHCNYRNELEPLRCCGEKATSSATLFSLETWCASETIECY